MYVHTESIVIFIQNLRSEGFDLIPLNAIDLNIEMI